MKVLLDIRDDKALFFMEVLKNFSYVKAKPISEAKGQLIEDIREAAREVKLAKEGKIKLQSAKDFLREL